MAVGATSILGLAFQLSAIAYPQTPIPPSTPGSPAIQALPMRPADPSAAYGTSAPEQTAAWIAATSGYMGSIGTNLGLLAHGRWYPFMANIQNLVWPPVVAGMTEVRKANPLINKKILKGAEDTLNSGKKHNDDKGDSRGGVVTEASPGENTACPSFTVTPDAALSGNNKEHLTSKTADQCEEACCGRSWCVSFDYYKETKECDLSDTTAAAAGGLKTDYANNPYDHYERPSATMKTSNTLAEATALSNTPGLNLTTPSQLGRDSPRNTNANTNSARQSTMADQLDWIGHSGADDGSSSPADDGRSSDAQPSGWSLKSHLVQLNKQAASHSNE